jgi:beta-lactamase class A
VVFLSTSLLFGQKENLEMVREKTKQKLVEIAARCRGPFGISAIDLTTGERIGVNDTLAFPQASAIKIPLMMEVFKQAHDGKFNLSDRRTIEHQKTVDGGVLYYFADNGSQVSIYDLCILMIVLSDNSATNILIDLVGMENVNRTLSSLGLKKTRLQRKMMDIDASARGEENLSTPVEAARIMQTLHTGAFVDKETCGKILAILRLPREIDGKIKSVLPEDVPVAYKVGEILPAVVTEWALVDLKGRPYVLVTMSNYGIEEDAATATKEVSRVVYDYFWRIGRATPHGTYNDPSLWK